MKQVGTVILIIILMLISSSCEGIIKDKKELNENYFVRIAGIDKINEDEVRLTLVAKTVISGGAEGTQRSDTTILTEEGRTIFEANRRAHAFTNRDLFWGHLEFLFIGEEAARDNIAKYLDFIVREHELRLTPTIVITKGTSAEDAIHGLSIKEIFLAELLENIVRNAKKSVSFSGRVPLIKLVNMMDREYESAYLPALKLVHKVMRQGGQKSSFDPQMDGYAIFKKKRLLGFITEERARGLNWIINEVESGFAIVKDEVGKEVSLEIIHAKSKIKPKIEGDALSVNIEVEFSSNITEYEGSQNIFDEEGIELLNQQQEKLVREEVEGIIEYAQTNGVDILGIGNAVYHKYPIKWDQYKDNWEEKHFRMLPIKVLITSKINRSYLFKEPIGYEGAR